MYLYVVVILGVIIIKIINFEKTILTKNRWFVFCPIGIESTS